MTVTVPDFNPILFSGLSTDTKPSTWIAPGNVTQATPERSLFMETDTGDEYFYDGSVWRFKSRSVNNLVPNEDLFFGFGEHDLASGNNLDVWGGPTDIQPEPVTAGYALFVESDSIQDDTDVGAGVPGTGAHVIHIHYLDTSGAEKSVSATLNGTTPVNTGVTDCMFVQQHHVTSFGTGGGIVSAGNIDCTNTSGGAVVSRVSAAGNQSMSTMRQVPAGKKLIVTGWHTYGVAATTKIANLRLRSTAHDGVLNRGVYHFHDSSRVKDSSSGHIPLQFECPPLATIKISGWTTGTISVAGRWGGYLEDV